MSESLRMSEVNEEKQFSLIYWKRVIVPGDNHDSLSNLVIIHNTRNIIETNKLTAHGATICSSFNAIFYSRSRYTGKRKNSGN